SPTRPSRIEQMVMPSWAAASIIDRFSPALMTVMALRLPCATMASSRSRRAEIRANSAATKKALPASSTKVRTTPKTSPMVVLLEFARLQILGGDRDQADPVDAPAVHALHACDPATPTGGAVLDLLT